MEGEHEPEDTSYLNSFFDELAAESDRGAALVGAALIDLHLRNNLSAFMVSDKAADAVLEGANAPIGTFSARINASFALGLLDEVEQKQCHIVRRIRNEFAHREHGISFKTHKIADICGQFELHFDYDSEYCAGKPRLLFNHSVTHLCITLYYRTDHIKTIKLVTAQMPRVLSD